MIEKLDHKNEEISRQIHSLFQASYRIEAKLLEAQYFPPLDRKISHFLNSDTEFYGLWRNKELAAAIEVNTETKNTDICSLVVHPKFFRQGLGKKLVQFVLNVFDSELFTVETGLKNEPASKLYKKLGFIEQNQWDTEFGVRKIKFKKTKYVDK